MTDYHRVRGIGRHKLGRFTLTMLLEDFICTYLADQCTNSDDIREYGSDRDNQIRIYVTSVYVSSTLLWEVVRQLYTQEYRSFLPFYTLIHVPCCLRVIDSHTKDIVQYLQINEPCAYIRI